MFSMVDEKVIAARNAKSTMRCYICGAVSKDFKNLKSLEAELVCENPCK